MTSMDTKIPIKANHRFLSKLIDTLLGGKVEHVPEEYDLISKVFLKLGGSWENIFHGSPEDIDLLKKVIRHAFKTDRMTKKQSWGA